MGRAAQERGYGYVAIPTTAAVGAVPGSATTSAARPRRCRPNELLAPFRVLRGIECDSCRTAG